MTITQRHHQDPKEPVNEFAPTGCRYLPNGCTLFWRPNEVGGRTFISDEVACGTVVWDTALVDKETLRAAIEVEAFMNGQEETVPTADVLALRLAETTSELRNILAEITRLQAVNRDLEEKLRLKEGAA